MAPGALSGDENTLFTAVVFVSDPNGDPIASLVAGGLPPGASFTKNPLNTSGTLSWNPSYTQSGVYTVTFTATNSLTGSAATTLTVNNVNGPPQIAAPTTVAGAENAPLTVTVSVSDPDGEAIASLTASDLPAGAAFTSGAPYTSGTLTWTPTFTQAGSYAVTFTATNALVGTKVTTLQIANTDRPPTVSAPVQAGILIPNVLTFTITASDIDGEPITSLRASNMPPRGRFEPDPGNMSGTFSWVTKKNDSGTYIVTFTASNASSGTARTTITCRDVDGPPIVTAPESLTVKALAPLTVNVDVYDPEGQAITSLTADGVPAGASFVTGPGNQSAVLSWTPGVGDQGAHLVTFRAANAFADTATTLIIVNPPDQAPVVTAPPAVGGFEAESLSFAIAAFDPEGEPLDALTASGLPAGASFTTAPDNQSGTVAWTPDYTQAGAYEVTFTASNIAVGSAVTTITIQNVDAAPVVTTPASASGKANTTITVTVGAADLDGDPITSLTVSPLPAAVFTSGSGNTSGTLTWTPSPGDVGTHPVTFTAQNALSGTASTVITVLPVNALPDAQLTVAPSTGNAPLLVTANASASSDPDGSVVSYRFDFGDGTVIGPAASATATHTYPAGTWTVTLTVTDDDGATASRSASVIVAPSPTQPNLVGNPSFESGTTGWGGYSGGTVQRVNDGFDGTFGLEVTGDSTTVSFGCNDAPNWVASVPAAGTVYRFTAWVRSSAHGGTAKIQVREYQGTERVGWLYSNGVVLSPAWQVLTVDYSTAVAGSTVDFQVVDFPLVPREVFVTDDIAIRDITGTTTAVDAGPLANGMAPLKAVLTPSPLRTRSTLVFATSRPGALRVTLYDVRGRRVREVARETNAPAGVHRFAVDGNAPRGEGLAAGVYFYRIEALEGASSGRFVVLR
jgi:PKD repeat protein